MFIFVVDFVDFINKIAYIVFHDLASFFLKLVCLLLPSCRHSFITVRQNITANLECKSIERPFVQLWDYEYNCRVARMASSRPKKNKVGLFLLVGLEIF